MWQLLYTSAPNGLTPGRSGFCVVARHKALPARVAEALERVSSYEPLVGRPVIFTHRLIAAGTETFGVISRFCDAGLDYTRRRNALAHHLIFAATEFRALPPPAEIALRWDGWLGKWDGQPRWLDDAGSAFPDALRSQRVRAPLITWAALSGDAANALRLCPDGAPAETLLDTAGDEDTAALDTADVLRLFAEASLFARGGPWTAGFATGLQQTDIVTQTPWRATGGAPVPANVRRVLRVRSLGASDETGAVAVRARLGDNPPPAAKSAVKPAAPKPALAEKSSPPPATGTTSTTAATVPAPSPPAASASTGKPHLRGIAPPAGEDAPRPHLKRSVGPRLRHGHSPAAGAAGVTAGASAGAGASDTAGGGSGGIIAVVFALLLLGVGGGAAWWFFVGQDDSGGNGDRARAGGAGNSAGERDPAAALTAQVAGAPKTPPPAQPRQPAPIEKFHAAIAACDWTEAQTLAPKVRPQGSRELNAFGRDLRARIVRAIEAKVSPLTVEKPQEDFDAARRAYNLGKRFPENVKIPVPKDAGVDHRMKVCGEKLLLLAAFREKRTPPLSAGVCLLEYRKTGRRSSERHQVLAPGWAVDGAKRVAGVRERIVLLPAEEFELGLAARFTGTSVEVAELVKILAKALEEAETELSKAPLPGVADAAGRQKRAQLVERTQKLRDRHRQVEGIPANKPLHAGERLLRASVPAAGKGKKSPPPQEWVLAHVDSTTGAAAVVVEFR